MKKYTIKNYKGNLVESLKNFSKKYKGMRITEAKVKDGELKVTAEAKEFSVDLECMFHDSNETIETVKAAAEKAAAKHNVTIVGVKEVDSYYANVIVSADAKDEKSLREFIRDFYYGGECTEQEIDDVLDESKAEGNDGELKATAEICEVKSYDGYNDDDYDDAIDIDSNYGDFCVELYKDHYGDPIRKDFDNFKDAFKFADSKTKSKQYEAILITVTVRGGPLVTSSYDNIHGCWVGRTN